MLSISIYRPFPTPTLYWRRPGITDVRGKIMSVEGWIAIIAGVVASLSAAYTTIAQVRAKLKGDENQQRLTAQEMVIDRQEKQLIRYQQQVEQQQEAIEKLYNASAQCREESAEHYGWMRTFHDSLIYMSGEVIRLGGNPGPIPNLPERKPRKYDTDSADFIHRTTAQNTELLKKVDPVTGVVLDPSSPPNPNPLPKP